MNVCKCHCYCQGKLQLKLKPPVLVPSEALYVLVWCYEFKVQMFNVKVGGSPADVKHPESVAGQGTPFHKLLAS